MNTETEKVLRRYFPAMLGWMLLSSAGGGSALLSSAGGGSEDIISARASKCQPRPRAGGWRAELRRGLGWLHHPRCGPLTILFLRCFHFMCHNI